MGTAYWLSAFLKVSRKKQDNYCQKRYLKWGLDIKMPVSKKRGKSSHKKKSLPGENKLSEVIMEFIRPLLERMDHMGMSKERHKNLIAFAILVWNMSFLPIKDREAQKNELVKNLSSTDNEQGDNDFHKLFNYLLLRKNNSFRNDNRLIIHYEIDEQGDNLRLTVGHQHMNK